MGTGESDLRKLLTGMRPELNPGRYRQSDSGMRSTHQ